MVAQATPTFFALYEKKITSHFKIAYLLIKPYERRRTMPCGNTPDSAKQEKGKTLQK